MTRLFGAAFVLATCAWPASLTYSTYLSEGFTPAAITADSSGNVYLAGDASGVGFASAAPSQVIVVKVNAGGTSYGYYRAIGGSARDSAAGIAVDSNGNAYVVGTATSPDFPVTVGQQVGTLPAPTGGSRAFLVKLNPQGEIVFSEVIANVNTTGLAVALTAAGDIVVSGTSATPLAATKGAYSSPNSTGLFLMEFDPTGANVLFMAAGIGGSALAMDPSGNIYMAGSTAASDYPTNPGPACTEECAPHFAPLQYITKVDAAASGLIYSRFVGNGGSTTNRGLAVDSSGNAYLTGVAPANTELVEPFLTKLDPSGATVLYSVPVGGSGVVFGSQNDLYVGGSYRAIGATNFDLRVLATSPPQGVSGLPSACQVNSITTFSEGVITHMDSATGNILGTALVDGSNLNLAGVAYAGGGMVWAAGSTQFADAPITQGALMPASLGRGPDPGAYLGEADFSGSPAAVPQIACILDSANMARVGVVAPGQLITLMGSGLGPATSITAANYGTTSLSGVTVTFNGLAAPLLYVSATQINVAVPAGVLKEAGLGLVRYALMQLMVNNVPVISRQIPLIDSNPSVFGDLSGAVNSCTSGGITSYGAFTDLALSADGNVNSCVNPASPGSSISLFLNGLGVNNTAGNGPIPWEPSQIPIAVTIGGWSAEVTNVTALNPSVWQVQVTVPALAQNSLFLLGVTVDLNLATGVVAAGPLSVQPVSPSYINSGTPILMSVWVKP